MPPIKSTNRKRSNSLSRPPVRDTLNHINFANPADKARHDKMVSLVESRPTSGLAAKQGLAGAKTDRDRNFWERKCGFLDKEIDRLVYELYGLTEEEIGMVEGRKES